jgi:predicted ABC-type ATPase
VKDPTPRLRMFAGPNGSGKSTLKSIISPDLIGLYINPDEIEKTIQKEGCFDFKYYEIETNLQELIDFFSRSTQIQSSHVALIKKSIDCKDSKIFLHDMQESSYFSAVLSDFIRNKLLILKKSFSFETVMSFPDKIELLCKAQKKGYRTYLYYIATESPDINVSRVGYRVSTGGHSVPEDKIINRYYRSLDLLMNAIRCSNRSYIFDNSGRSHMWLAEITDGIQLEMRSEQMPTWFKQFVWEKFQNLQVR